MNTFQVRLNKSAQSQAAKAAVAFKAYKALLKGDALDALNAQTELSMARHYRAQAMLNRTWAQCSEYRY